MGEKRPGGARRRDGKPNVAGATLRFLEALERYMRATQGIAEQGRVIGRVSRDVLGSADGISREASRFRIR